MEELDLKELFEIFWSKKKHVALIIAIFIVIGIIYTVGFTVPKYTSSTTLVLTTTSSNSGSQQTAVDSSATQNTTTSDAITTTDVTLNSKLVSTYSELVKSKNVLRTVINNLNIDVDEEDIRNNVTVSSVEDTELIEITVTNENPTYSEKIANEIANVFAQKIQEIYNINNVYIVDEAEASDTPSNINHIKDVVIFALIGFVISVAYVMVVNMLDTTVKSTQDIEKLTRMPVIASIPECDFDKKKLKGGKK